MASEQHQNINLLPHDLQTKRDLVKKELAGMMEYTEPTKEGADGHVEAKPEPSPVGSAPDFLTRRKLPPLASWSTPATPPESQTPAAAPLASKPEIKDQLQPKQQTGWFARLFSGRAKPAADEPAADVKQDAKQEEAAAQSSVPAAESAGPKEEILDVNLLSQEYAQAFVLKNQVVVYFWALAVSLLAVAVGFAGAKLYETREQSRLAQERGRNQALSEVIVSYRDLAVTDGLLKRKVQALRALFKKHISFKTFLEQLEAVTIPEVTYQNIAVTGKGGVGLAARATDYTAAARQLSVFQTRAPWVKTVVMTGARAVPGAESKSGGVSFDLALTVDESVFIAKE